MVHIPENRLGEIVKNARQNANLTVEALSERLQITPRYLYRIENEGQKPSFDLLFLLVRELSIPPDLIFYPDKEKKDTEMEGFIHLLYKLNKPSIEVLRATAIALMEAAVAENNSEK